MRDVKKDYFLMDGRASYDTDAAVVILVGSAQECCESANSGEFGGDCIVVDPDDLEPVWEWFATGKWIAE